MRRKQSKIQAYYASSFYTNSVLIVGSIRQTVSVSVHIVSQRTCNLSSYTKYPTVSFKQAKFEVRVIPGYGEERVGGCTLMS